MAGQAFGTAPELTLLALTAALTAGGLLALRRRDAGRGDVASRRYPEFWHEGQAESR
ncbi:hypothetical protein ACIBQ6_23525 [Nonomuraea sp. NPDC049655]|uniref:hypothetical protein n=1 Tax=Nonomuraea sp. NPDC049655 TaxID=3364355 RepID=UPI00379D4DFA